MNVAFLLKPKSEVAYLYEDYTIRQALEKMKHHGYTAIPVITREGQYKGVVSEGDFLWYLIRGEANTPLTQIDVGNVEDIGLADLPFSSTYQPVHITATVEQLMETAIIQNFVPVTDDLGSFIGIITRRDIMMQLKKHFNT